jgi:hypothetical protein
MPLLPLTAHRSPIRVIPAISRRPTRAATWIGLAALAALWGCGAPRPVESPTPAETPAAPRVLPLARVTVLETSGPPPSDTTVSFTAGTPHTIVLRHGPPENIVFARLSFTAGAFADSGQTVTVEVHPRPGVYGLDVAISLPLRADQATVLFDYARYFSAPARARQVYGSDIAFERALAVGRLLPENQIELLPSTRPAPDNLSSSLPAPGSYLVAAPQ